MTAVLRSDTTGPTFDFFIDESALSLLRSINDAVHSIHGDCKTGLSPLSPAMYIDQKTQYDCLAADVLDAPLHGDLSDLLSEGCVDTAAWTRIILFTALALCVFIKCKDWLLKGRYLLYDMHGK